MRDGHAKQIVYRYNGHISSEEVEFDALGNRTFTKGEVVRRLGKNWTVQSVQLESVIGDSGAPPSLRIDLVDESYVTGSRNAVVSRT